MKEPRLLATFGKPFKFQVAAFRLRLTDLRDTAVWTDLWQAEHDRAFMVAGATKAGILSDLAAAVDKAIAEGTGLEAFKKDFRKIIADKGWLLSPAGQGKDGKGAWRARLIYRTNMSTSYAAGRMAQLVAANYPFWVYRHGASLEPREQHLAWDGLILPPDHPFWATHAPPNGWGCSCYVVGARSMTAAKILGGKPDLKLPTNWKATDPRTGAPIGIDKGWAYAPGASVASTVAAMAAKAVDWDYSLAVAYMRSVPAETRDQLSDAYRNSATLPSALTKFSENAALATPDQLLDLPPQKTLGLISNVDLSAIFALLGQSQPADLYDFVLGQSAARHIFDRHGNAKIELSRGQRVVSPSDFGLLPLIVSKPDSIRRAKGRSGQAPVVEYSKVINGERHVVLFEVLTRRRRLSLLTMWVEKVGASPTMTP